MPEDKKHLHIVDTGFFPLQYFTRKGRSVKKRTRGVLFRKIGCLIGNESLTEPVLVLTTPKEGTIGEAYQLFPSGELSDQILFIDSTPMEKEANDIERLLNAGSNVIATVTAGSAWYDPLLEILSNKYGYELKRSRLDFGEKRY